MRTRRQILGLAAGLSGLYLSGALESEIQKASDRLKILFLGGTGFIGPHQIEHAIARGHEVSMFNRGRRRPGLYGDAVEELIGNRDARVDAGLASLEGERTWDVVIDNSGYVPRHVRDSVKLLRERCARYIYVSTVGVYDFEAGTEIFPEDGPLAPLEDKSLETVTNESYGPLKTECDRLVEAELGNQATIVRPTYIVGPGDTTDRFTYWVDRVNRGGDMLAPSAPDKNYQWIDARDLCPWIIDLAERDQPGIYNAAGPASTISRAGTLWGLRALTDKALRFHWPSDELLAELEIHQPTFGPGPGYHFSNEAALAAGMPCRSLADTANATQAWWDSLPVERRSKPRGWLDPETEAAAIARIA